MVVGGVGAAFNSRHTIVVGGDLAVGMHHRNGIVERAACCSLEAKTPFVIKFKLIF